MASQTYRRGEVSALGEAIYREKIRSRVEPQERGKFVVIDIETGDYELDATTRQPRSGCRNDDRKP